MTRKRFRIYWPTARGIPHSHHRMISVVSACANRWTNGWCATLWCSNKKWKVANDWISSSVAPWLFCAFLRPPHMCTDNNYVINDTQCKAKLFTWSVVLNIFNAGSKCWKQQARHKRKIRLFSDKELCMNSTWFVQCSWSGWHICLVDKLRPDKKWPVFSYDISKWILMIRSWEYFLMIKWLVSQHNVLGQSVNKRILQTILSEI